MELRPVRLLEPRPYKEEDLQKSVASYLNDLYVLKKLLWCHVPNESMIKAPIQWHVKRKKLGVKAGFPDILIIAKDKCIFIELKVNPNKEKKIDGMRLLGREQKIWMESLIKFGHSHYIICVVKPSEAVKQMTKILIKEKVLSN